MSGIIASCGHRLTPEEQTGFSVAAKTGDEGTSYLVLCYYCYNAYLNNRWIDWPEMQKLNWIEECIELRINVRNHRWFEFKIDCIKLALIEIGYTVSYYLQALWNKL